MPILYHLPLLTIVFCQLQAEWMEHYRLDYLREMIWLEGRGGRANQKFCTGCGGEGGFVYRCKSCIGAEPLCKACIIAVHHHNPFHFVEVCGRRRTYCGPYSLLPQVWNGSHYEDTTLKAIGLRIQLGHPPGRRCEAPQSAHNDDFVVIDTTGIHEVCLQFCGCDGYKTRHVQLLRYKLFPGTGVDPRSAATFRVMKFFQILSFESKGSHDEFYRAIVRLTGNVKARSSRVRLLNLLFRHRLTETTCPGSLSRVSDNGQRMEALEDVEESRAWSRRRRSF